MIKFIYFDVGGVVIQDFSGNNQWEDLRAELGIGPDKLERFNELWALYGKDLNSTLQAQDVLEILKTELGLDLPEHYSFLHAFVRRFQANHTIWPILEAAKQKTRIGLLTNMYHGMFDAISEAGYLPDIAWGVIMDSSIEGTRKPFPEFYELAEKRAGVAPQEILFIDNLQENLDVADELGWKTYFYDSTTHTQSSEKLLEYIRHL